MASGEMQERIDRMRDKAATKPRSFQFTDEQNEFVGHFLRWEQSPPHPTYGTALLGIFSEYPSGEEVTIWLYHRVMRNALLRQNPQPGEFVYVKRGEKHTPEGGGNSYFEYAVVVDRQNGNDGLSVEEARMIANRMPGGVDTPEVDPIGEAEAHEAAMQDYEPAPVEDEVPF